jgi:hypothetical protein
VEQTQAIAAPVPVVAPVIAAPVASAVDETESTNNLLQLARRLHEEHVRDGVEKRDALIAEGHATAARVVAEAEAKQRSQLTALESERSSIEHQIEELRNFERDYRAKLKSYIEGQLRDLDSAGVGTNGFNPVGVQPAGQFAAVAAGDADRQTPPTYQSFGG